MPEMPVNVVLQGDCLEVLRTLPDNSVDAVVTDPPAGIAFMGKEWDDFRRARNPADAGRDSVFGRTSATGPEYGRSERDAFVGWLRLVMVECLRVLKPGGHALVWSIPRTSHWTGTAIEEAGFELRDSILHCFGSGFPKSLNISKALDRKAGATRKVVKEGRGFDPLKHKEGQFDSILPSNVGINTAAFNAKLGEVTEPATEEARKWDGWGTQLKPAVEVWWLCRKPITAPNIVAQVLRTGTGAINIDGARIKTEENLNGGAYAEDASDRHDGAENWRYKRGEAGEFQQPKGRWPANLVLSHSPTCKRVGTRTVEAPTINRFDDGMKPFGDGAGHPYTSSGGGTEEQPVYECEPGCPIRAMDEQSGESTSVGGNASGGSAFGQGSGWNPHENKVTEIARQGDSGGASRFFANFEPDAQECSVRRDEPSYEEPFIYTGKASKRDKNADLGAVNPAEEGLINKHPTVKGQELMRYLVRLITPPGGIVLDPFAGSGSTLVAAITEGFRFIGIEREDEYFQIAKTRTDKALGRAQAEAVQKDAFDLMGELPED